MKKKIAIFFLWVFLGANTEIHHLIGLPVSIQHFLEDTDKHDASLACFFENHHADSDGQEKSGCGHKRHDLGHHHNHDHRMSCKPGDCPAGYLLLAFAAASPYAFPDHDFLQKKGFPSYTGVIYSPAHADNIWQPPKNA